jgi:cbb3-type cytochrome oxidase cytochrome c subunit
MPATEETYRSQPGLHVVFALCSIGMTLSIVWMIMADHLRPWKETQRKFHRIEEAKLEANKVDKLNEQKAQHRDDIAAIDEKIKKARADAELHASDLRAIDNEIRLLGGKYEALDTQKRFVKAELDSQRSLYDGMVDLDKEREARAYVKSTIVATEAKLDDLSEKHEKADAELREAKARRERLLGGIDDLEKERDRLTREVDRVDRVLKQKDQQYNGFFAWLRGLPGFDLVPPTKIQQISLPELTINYNFKEVPRYDRCTTCHGGIDKDGYETDAQGMPMETVFAAHPHLSDGATAIDPKGKVVTAGLYLHPNGPHPINSFGCTICHGGQGSGTDFTYASHTPNDEAQKEEWEKKLAWHEIHMWDEPMLPKRFLESSCLKCHHEVTDVPQAKKLQAGYERIVRYGCTGCHTIGGEGSFGPDLTDERQVGPNLTHIGSKLPKEWVLKWIKNPHAFRPDSRMPRFYGVSNNSARDDQPKSHAEIHAIAHYLYAKSTPPADFVDPPAKPDPARGKELFLQKGCMACHSHRPYAKSEVQPADEKKWNDDYKPDPKATYDPSQFPESVRKYARAEFGPNLSNIAAKFASKESGYKWLANWINKPTKYHPNSLMPDLQVPMEDAADIAAWILSVPGEWPVKVEVPAVDSKEVKDSVDELVRLYVTKGGFKHPDTGKTEAVPLSKVDKYVAGLSSDEKLMYLGEKTISRLGCFGCHTISGFENAKPIGTPLNGWGIKQPARLDFAHINEYLFDQKLGDNGDRDGTDLYFQEKIAEHSRPGFLFQKLHRPRSYDFAKTNEDLKTWDDRLRMPQFAWANDPAAIEEVMTFVLGLTGEKIGARYLPKIQYTPRQHALAQGAKVLNRYNCDGCHVLEMPKYTIEAGRLAEALPSIASNLRASYTARGTDYLSAFYPGSKFDPKAQLDGDKVAETLGFKPGKKEEVVLEGMPIGQFENELTVQLWKPVTIGGYTFNVGDTLTLDQSKVTTTPAVGGHFAWLYATYTSDRTGTEFSSLWNRLPPPLVREGKKVQTPWLTNFLKDPYAIRPAVNLRMPHFHYKVADNSPGDETSQLANYFAARDGAEFPYQSIPERNQDYLAERESKHPDYFAAGWRMMTEKTSPCLSCHAVGQFKPTGGSTVINGPDMRQVANRFRPEFLAEWLAKPSRLVPYTAMPQNIVPTGALQVPVPKSFEDQRLDMVKAIRDTLLNYTNAVEGQLAVLKPPDATGPAPSKPAGGSD